MTFALICILFVGIRAYEEFLYGNLLLSFKISFISNPPREILHEIINLLKVGRKKLIEKFSPSLALDMAI